MVLSLYLFHFLLYFSISTDELEGKKKEEALGVNYLSFCGNARKLQPNSDTKRQPRSLCCLCSFLNLLVGCANSPWFSSIGFKNDSQLMVHIFKKCQTFPSRQHCFCFHLLLTVFVPISKCAFHSLFVTGRQRVVQTVERERWSPTSLRREETNRFEQFNYR